MEKNYYFDNNNRKIVTQEVVVEEKRTLKDILFTDIGLDVFTKNDDEADEADKSKTQVYREHRLLSLSTEGLLEVAAFKVFIIFL